MDEAPVLCAVDPRGVATVTLNRPARNNAYDRAMLDGLIAGCERLAGDDAVRVVVVRGAGRHFQAGADLDWLTDVAARDLEANLEASRVTARSLQLLNALPKPTVALVHGACVGGGTGVVASCDIVVASRDATFSISEARWGLVAGIIFPQLVAAIGVRQLRRYALTCERFDAEQAVRLGLVHEVCEPGSLDAAAAPIIDGLLAAGPGAVVRSKLGALRVAGALPDGAPFDALIAEHAEKRRSAEAAEGLASFRERRDAAWGARR